MGFTDEESRLSRQPYSSRQPVVTSRPKIPVLQFFSQSHSPANRRTIIYVVDSIEKTTEEKGDKRQGQPVAQVGRYGRDREKEKMRYPLIVLLAPLVFALPFVVLRTRLAPVDGRERGQALTE